MDVSPSVEGQWSFFIFLVVLKGQIFISYLQLVDLQCCILPVGVASIKAIAKESGFMAA